MKVKLFFLPCSFFSLKIIVDYSLSFNSDQFYLTNLNGFFYIIYHSFSLFTEEKWQTLTCMHAVSKKTLKEYIKRSLKWHNMTAILGLKNV